MLHMYWDIGRMVAERQGLVGWGKGLLRRLADDLKNELPVIKGFSGRNLQLMIQFQKEYPDLFFYSATARCGIARRICIKKNSATASGQN